MTTRRRRRRRKNYENAGIWKTNEDFIFSTSHSIMPSFSRKNERKSSISSREHTANTASLSHSFALITPPTTMGPNNRTRIHISESVRLSTIRFVIWHDGIFFFNGIRPNFFVVVELRWIKTDANNELAWWFKIRYNPSKWAKRKKKIFKVIQVK